MPLLSLEPLFIEDNTFVTVRSPPDFVNQENETTCYSNSTFQHLYYNLLFRELVFKINCYTMLNVLKRGSQHFVHISQKIMIFREFQKCFGGIYLEKKISTDIFFMLENITTNCHMDASEFEGMLYTMLSEEPFANHILDMTDGNEEYTISDHVSQNFAITIGETCTCLTVNRENETRCYLNLTFQHLYFNVIFRELVLKSIAIPC